MRILHAVPVFFPEGPGGIQNHVREIALRQRELGHDPVLLSGSLEGRRVPELVEQRAEGCRVLRLHRADPEPLHYAHGHDVAASRIVREVLAAERPDVLHVHSWIGLSSDLVAAAEERGIATVVTLHDQLPSCPRAYRMDRDGLPCRRPFGREACTPCAPRLGAESDARVAAALDVFARALGAELERARVVTVATPGAAADLASFTGRATVEPVVLPPGYRPHGIEAAPPAANAGPLRIGCWGRLGPHKGLAELLEGFGRVAAGTPAADLELHVFGPVVPEAFAAEQRRRAGDRPVVWHGPYDFERLARARLHAAAFGSRCLETWGFVIDEARELGLPLLLPELGAYGERAAGDTLSVGDGTASAWAEAFGRLGRDPMLLDRLRSAEAPASLDVAQHVDRLQDLYARALELPSAAGPPAPTPEEWAAARGGR